ncbi:MAG: hypothetical protein R3F40_01920 [Candidatus Competibacteraceae bacterium]
MKPGHGKIQFRVFWLLFLAMALSATCLVIRQSPLVLSLNLLLLVVLAAALFQWVNRPLRTIVRSLYQHDPPRWNPYASKTPNSVGSPG